MSDPKYVLLDLSTLSTATEVIESELIACGIPVVRMEVGARSVYPTGPMNWFDLYVPEGSLAAAQEILEKMSQMEENPPEETGSFQTDNSTPSDIQG